MSPLVSMWVPGTGCRCWESGVLGGGQGRGPYVARAGTAPLSPAIQDSVGVWLSLPEGSVPLSLFPTVSNSSSLTVVPG